MADIKINGDDEVLTEKVMEELSKLDEQQEEKQDLIMVYPPIEFSDDELTELCNTDEWKKGYLLGAELSGLATVLYNSGVDAITANNILSNHHAMYVNIETQKIINEGVRIQGVAIKKAQL